MSKILLIGGSRDGEWIEDPGLPRYHVILQDLKSVYDIDNPDIFARHETEVYKRRTTHFKEGQEHSIYRCESIDDYTAFDFLLRYYNPKPPAAEPPKPQPQPMDLNVERRKAEDKLAAAAWNDFMSQPIPKQK